MTGEIKNEPMIKVLVFADTHLGFDYTFKPRIKRRRRGNDFFSNFKLVLNQALEKKVDFIVHGGDIFFRSRVPGKLVDMVFEQFFEVADKGVPIYIVPGNHERSRIPHALLTAHPNIFVFDEAKTYVFRKKDTRVALSGFPCVRKNIRTLFKNELTKTGWRQVESDIYLLCMHQTVDGATTGPGNYMFRGHADVIDLADIPDSFSAVLTGHMHRHQILKSKLSGVRCPCPVFYPGSIERTSFAEQKEDKGYLILEFKKGCSTESTLISSRFIKLPARPMIEMSYNCQESTADAFNFWFEGMKKFLPADAILKIKILGLPDSELMKLLSISNLRKRLPDTMNISVQLQDFRKTN